METEQQLISAIRDGDRRAMRRLYERYAGYALATGQRYIADDDDVRDVVQDSFVAVLTHISDFHYQGEGSLKAWVKRIVVNHAVDHLRQHERMVVAADLTPITPEPSEEDEPPEIDRLPPDELTRMIARLPAGYRAVLNLHVFEQMPHRDIAQRLGISERTSASQFSRAKRLLARMIEQHINHKSS